MAIMEKKISGYVALLHSLFHVKIIKNLRRRKSNKKPGTMEQRIMWYYSVKNKRRK